MRTLFSTLGLAFVTISACTREPAPPGEAAFQGHWEGAVEFTDRKMPVIFDVAVEENGRTMAEADLPSDGLEDYPIELHVQGDSVHIRIQSLEGSPEMRGRLDARAQRIRGDFAFGDVRFPMELQRTGIAKISSARKAFEAAPKKPVTVVSADAHELRDAFNRDAGKTRLLLFLSPT